MAGPLTALRVPDHSDPACFPSEAAIFGSASGNRGSVFIAAKTSDSRVFATTAGGEGSQAGLPNLAQLEPIFEGMRKAGIPEG